MRLGRPGGRIKGRNRDKKYHHVLGDAVLLAQALLQGHLGAQAETAVHHLPHSGGKMEEPTRAG